MTTPQPRARGTRRIRRYRRRPEPRGRSPVECCLALVRATVARPAPRAAQPRRRQRGPMPSAAWRRHGRCLRGRALRPTSRAPFQSGASLARAGGFVERGITPRMLRRVPAPPGGKAAERERREASSTHRPRVGHARKSGESLAARSTIPVHVARCECDPRSRRVRSSGSPCTYREQGLRPRFLVHARCHT